MYNRFTSTTKKLTLEQPPSDSVSAIAWGTPSPQDSPPYKPRNQQTQVKPPAEQRLAVASWDGTIRVYRVSANGSSNDPIAAPLQMFTLTSGPVICLCMDAGSFVFSGSGDGVVRVHDVQKGDTKELGKHDGPVADVVYDSAHSRLCSGGVDGKLKFWDGISINTPVAERNEGQIIRKMDCRNGYLVAMLANQTVKVYHIATQNELVMDNSKFTEAKGNYSESQWTCVTLVPSETPSREPSCQGILLGAASGRLAYLPFETRATIPDRKAPIQGILQSPLLISLHPPKAKRDQGETCYPIHDVDINFKMIVCSGGSDGNCVMYSLLKRANMQTYALEGPVVAARLDPFGLFMAVGISYDWVKGYKGNDGRITPAIHIINVGDEIYNQSRYLC